MGVVWIHFLFLTFCCPLDVPSFPHFSIETGIIHCCILMIVLKKDLNRVQCEKLLGLARLARENTKKRGSKNMYLKYGQSQGKQPPVSFGSFFFLSL